MNRKLTFYLTALAAFAAFLYLIAHIGSAFEGPEIARPEAVGTFADVFGLFGHNLLHVPGLALMQILVIVAAARICGLISVKLGQPAVIGEVVSGILLGPSLLGTVAPEFSLMLFAPPSLPGLSLLSQVGLILFMFVIGMELDPALLRNRADSAVVISHVSIILPFALGMAASLVLYSLYAPAHVPFLSFSLFMGIAMSITAFPVLARILHDRGLSSTPAGALSLACAAADDVTAWSALAVVIAIARAGDPLTGFATLVAAGIYVAIMLGFVRPFLKKVGEIHAHREGLTGPVVTGILLYAIASALFTQVAGIHALFGAFLAGALMPEKGPFRRLMTEKVHDVSVYILLPIFFAFTGLRTQLGLLNSASHWWFTALIILVAVVGKFGGSALAGRFLGESWRNSLLIGALMNTRGLMELVVLNIGLELGVISPVIFTMMVIMALATTFMAGPSITLIERLLPDHREQSSEKPILVAYARAETGQALLRVGSIFAEHPILSLHITPDTQRSSHDIEAFRSLHSEELVRYASSLGIRHSGISRAADDITSAIIEEAKKRHPSLLLLGGSLALFSPGPLSGRNRELIDQVSCPVGVLIDRVPSDIKSIIFVGDENLETMIRILPLPSSTDTKVSAYSPNINPRSLPTAARVRALKKLPLPESSSLLIMDEIAWKSRSWNGYSVLVLFVPTGKS